MYGSEFTTGGYPQVIIQNPFHGPVRPPTCICMLVIIHVKSWHTQVNPSLVTPLICSLWMYLLRYIVGFCYYKVKNFMDTTLVYSRMHLIGILKCLWLITTKTFSMPSLLVPHNSCRPCMLLWSTPAKHRRHESFYLNFVCEFGITFAAEVSVESKNIPTCMLKNFN